MPFLGAVAAAGWYGGYRPGIVAALLSYVVANYLFISPRYEFSIPDGGTAIGLVLYLLSAATVIVLVDRLRHSEHQRKLLAETLAHALEGGDVVGWEWIGSTRRVVLTDNAQRILGVPHRTLTPFALLRRFPPPDRRVFIGALRSSASGTQRVSAEVRFNRPGNPRTIWLRCQAQLVHDAQNRFSCLRGVFIEETPRLRAEVALREAEARFRKSHDRSLRGYSLFTAVRAPNGDIVDFTWAYINRAGARPVKRRVSDLVGNTLLSMVPDVPARNELYDRMKQVAVTGEAQDVDLYHEARDVRGWFRNMIVQTDDGVAVESFDITEPTRLQAELRKTAAEVNAANKRKSEFLALLAHELRTPLAPLRTGVHILSMQVEDTALRPLIQIMERQVLHIVRLIDDLLDLTRIERGKIDLHREKVLLRDVLRRGVELSQVNIEARHHTLITDIEIPHVYLDVDPTRIAQVISNLLNNAAKFMSAGGRIWLTARKHGAMADITVRDEGRGILPADLSRIFERFVQCPSQGEERGAGLGLGLALVKSLVDLHGGTVRAHSEGPQQGSEFTVQLPISIDVRESSPAASRETNAASGVDGTRIMIIDDDRDTVEVLAQALSAMNAEVDKATDGEQAMHIADRLVPDVMLVDIGMPGLDGYDIARITRAKPWGSTPLLVALTGWGQDEDKERALSAGFDYHLTKPVDLRAIVEVIATSERRNKRATTP